MILTGQWQIIEGTTIDGQGIEWQVSDGDVGSRSTSYDFLTLKEAEECCANLNGNWEKL